MRHFRDLRARYHLRPLHLLWAACLTTACQLECVDFFGHTPGQSIAHETVLLPSAITPTSTESTLAWHVTGAGRAHIPSTIAISLSPTETAFEFPIECVILPGITKTQDGRCSGNGPPGAEVDAQFTMLSIAGFDFAAQGAPASVTIESRVQYSNAQGDFVRYEFTAPAAFHWANMENCK